MEAAAQDRAGLWSMFRSEKAYGHVKCLKQTTSRSHDQSLLPTSAHTWNDPPVVYVTT